MKQRTANNITAFIAGILAFVCFYMLFNEAGATGTKPHSQDQDQSQQQDQSQGQDQAQSQTINIGGGGEPLADGGDLSMVTDDDITIDASESNNIENNSSNVVLVPNNNTESCLRVWGIAFGKNGESAALGIPWRSKQCDFEQAADDAFAAGERELGWFWKCQNKSLYRIFRLDGMSDDEAKHECHKKAVGHVSNLQTIDKLKSDLAFIQNERRIEREKCDESKDRLTKAWADSCAGKE